MGQRIMNGSMDGWMKVQTDKHQKSTSCVPDSRPGVYGHCLLIFTTILWSSRYRTFDSEVFLIVWWGGGWRWWEVMRVMVMVVVVVLLVLVVLTAGVGVGVAVMVVMVGGGYSGSREICPCASSQNP